MYEKILAESQRLQHDISALEKRISQFPEGDCYCVHDKKRKKWFHSLNGQRHYLTKKEHQLKKQLINKKFFTLFLKDLQQKKIAADAYLARYSTKPGQNLLDFLNNTDYQEFFSQTAQTTSSAITDWLSASFEKNPNYPEQLIFPTSSGNLVRSKSEVLIDMYLHLNQIPFRYECALNLGFSTYYPDFTILHPVTCETLYWEHFGLMDDPIYTQNTFNKLQNYISHQIFPGKQLIMTFENKKYPLSPETIQKTIQHYLL